MNGFTGSGGAAYSSDRMDWETPQELFDQLDAEFHFTLDAASSDANHKCKKYYTRENSAFDHSWGGGVSFLQSSIRQNNLGVGAQMQYGGQPQRHSRRHAAARQNGHAMVPRAYPASCGNTFPQGTAQVRNRWYTDRSGTVPQHDRGHAHWGKVNR